MQDVNEAFGNLFEADAPALVGNFATHEPDRAARTQEQTTEVFSEKWSRYEGSGESERFYEFQRRWYLALYGFGTEGGLRRFLADKEVIFDAGCGLGYKAAWLAGLAPHALVVGMDYSEAAELAARRYADVTNLVFMRGDIARTGFRDAAISYVSCDQVIMHTQDPEATFAEFARVTSSGGEIACYFYAKKALPRELLDEHFRSQCLEMSNDELWAMSEQLTDLGQRLSALQATFECPDIPALGIKGGTYDVQRFIYWNLLKCFWNADLGRETSVATNFDWYSPSNAARFSESEVRGIAERNAMAVLLFHSEEAAHAGRFGRGVR